MTDYGAANREGSSEMEHQFLKVSELGDLEVGTHSRLLTLVSCNSNARMRFEDHRDVVSAVAYRSTQLILVPFDQLYHLGLLQRSTSANSNRRCHASCLQK